MRYMHITGKAEKLSEENGHAFRFLKITLIYLLVGRHTEDHLQESVLSFYHPGFWGWNSSPQFGTGHFLKTKHILAPLEGPPLSEAQIPEQQIMKTPQISDIWPCYTVVHKSSHDDTSKDCVSCSTKF